MFVKVERYFILRHEGTTSHIVKDYCSQRALDTVYDYVAQWGLTMLATTLSARSPFPFEQQNDESKWFRLPMKMGDVVFRPSKLVIFPQVDRVKKFLAPKTMFGNSGKGQYIHQKLWVGRLAEDDHEC